jgi:RNA polymerase sigma-70 factor (ECF subfamily)
MGTDSEIELMLRFSKGDENAFRTLFLAYKKKIVNYCYRFFFNQDTAEEVSQEIFLKVYKAGPRYTPTASFSTWIFKIATHACLNELRRDKHKSFIRSIDSDEEMGGMELADDNAGPHARIEASERKKRIGKALRSLPGKQRAAILLREYQGFSYKEIGDQMGMSEAGIKSLIHRGRESLRNMLYDEFGEDS